MNIRRFISFVLSLVITLALIAPLGASAQEMAPPDHGEGQRASAENQATVEQTIKDFETSVNAKDPTVAQMISGDFAQFLMQLFGQDNIGVLPDMQIHDTSNALSYPDGWASVDVSFSGLMTPHSYTTWRLYLNGPQSRVIEQFEPIEIVVPDELSSAAVNTTVSDAGYVLDRDSVPASDVVVVNVENTGSAPYFTMVAQLPDGMAVMDAPWVDLTPTTLGGLMTAPQGDDQAGYFDLEPGTYVLVQATMTQTGPVSTGYVASFAVAKPGAA